MKVHFKYNCQSVAVQCHMVFPFTIQTVMVEMKISPVVLKIEYTSLVEGVVLVK